MSYPNLLSARSLQALESASHFDYSWKQNPAVTNAPERLSKKNFTTIAVLIVSSFVVILNETIMNVALPVLMHEFNVTPDAIQWLSTIFMLTMAVVIPMTGFLLQRLSVRNVFVLAIGLFTLGSALAAFGVGRYSQTAGRRRGLATGFALGAAGAAAIVVAAVIDSPVLFFVSLFVYGAGTATNLQARYAGTDLAPSTQRATAAMNGPLR